MRYSIRLDLHDRPRKDGSRTIRFRVTWSGQRVTHYLSTPISPDDWDYAAGRPKRNAQRAAREADRLITAVDDLFDLCSLQRRFPTADDVKAALGHNPTNTQQLLPSHNLVQAMDSFILEQATANSWSDATARRFRGIRHHLEAWDPRATVEDMDENHMKSFVAHLYADGLINSTVQKDLAQLRWFLRWCQGKGWTTSDTWNTYRPRFKEPADKAIIYLSQEELHKLTDLDLSTNQCLSQVRDVFLFCCYTGLRYSDVAKLDWADVTSDGFTVITQKTGDRLFIDFNRFSRAIVDKYRTLEPPIGRVLPVISNQKMNDYLKNIAQMAGIDAPIRQIYYVRGTRHEEVKPKYELVTTHCGRRTFVVMALSLGISPQVVMKITGHSDYKAMLPYIDITSHAKKSAMSKFDAL